MPPITIIRGETHLIASVPSAENSSYATGEYVPISLSYLQFHFFMLQFHVLL